MGLRSVGFFAGGFADEAADLDREAMLRGERPAADVGQFVVVGPTSRYHPVLARALAEQYDPGPSPGEEVIGRANNR